MHVKEISWIKIDIEFLALKKCKKLMNNEVWIMRYANCDVCMRWFDSLGTTKTYFHVTVHRNGS